MQAKKCRHWVLGYIFAEMFQVFEEKPRKCRASGGCHFTAQLSLLDLFIRITTALSISRTRRVWKSWLSLSLPLSCHLCPLSRVTFYWCAAQKTPGWWSVRNKGSLISGVRSFSNFLTSSCNEGGTVRTPFMLVIKKGFHNKWSVLYHLHQ